MRRQSRESSGSPFWTPASTAPHVAASPNSIPSDASTVGTASAPSVASSASASASPFGSTWQQQPPQSAASTPFSAVPQPSQIPWAVPVDDFDPFNTTNTSTQDMDTDKDKEKAKTQTDETATSSDVLVAFDGSGSTGGCQFYHQQTQRIVADLPTARILFWDHAHRPISRGQLALINQSYRGGGGTETDQVARYIREIDFHGHLVIITDGQVYTQSIDRCAAMLGPEWKFEFVTAHLIGERHSVNLSITCPFTRTSPHTIYTYYRDLGFERQLCTDVTQRDFAAFDAIDRIDSMAAFEQHADAIERVIVAQQMGSASNPQLYGALNNMRQRIDQQQQRQYGAAASVFAMPNQSAVYGGGFTARYNRCAGMAQGAIRGTYDMSQIASAVQQQQMQVQPPPPPQQQPPFPQPQQQQQPFP